MINLLKGHPDSVHLAGVRSLLATASAALLNDASGDVERSVLQYTSAQGPIAYRQSLADWYKQQGIPGGCAVPRASNFLVTNGISGGIELAVTALEHSAEQMFCERSSYFAGLRIFRDARVPITGVRYDADGLDTEHLEQLLTQGSPPSPQAPPRLVYVIPTHGNPSGAVLSHVRRQHLVRLAQQHNLLVLADEVYQFMTFPRHRSTLPPPPPLALYPGAAERVISMGSFSKQLAPGLRLGWMLVMEAEPQAVPAWLSAVPARTSSECDTDAPALVKRIVSRGYLSSGGCIAPFQAGIVAHALKTGLHDLHVAAMMQDYQDRYDVLSRSIAQHCEPLGCKVVCPAHGGYFLMLRLPDGMSARALLAQCKEDVMFLPGHRCASDPEHEAYNDQYVRLCFAHLPPNVLAEGVERLGAAITAYRA